MGIRTLIIIFLCMTSFLASQDVSPKCGTWRNIDRIKRNSVSKEMKVTVTRPVKLRNVLSPNGLFRIHFDTTGMGAPTMVTSSGVPILGSYKEYVDSVAAIFDEVYSIEIGRFGYPAPANDGILGGGSEYDIYIENLGVGSYGFVNFDDDINLTPGKTNPQFPCYIVIDNSFESGYYTIGLNAVRVTAAHEFHHMIEVSTSGVWYDDFYFYEMCATGMESTVFPEVRDYLQYVKTYYQSFHSWPLFLQTQGTGYERGIFAKFLMEKFGTPIMNDIWTEVKTHRPVKALQNALNSRSTSLEREFSEFSLWNYYTNNRGDSTRYFVDAFLLPKLLFVGIDSLSILPIQKQLSLKPFAIHYHRFLSKQTKVDTVDIIISNTNISEALSGNLVPSQYDLTVSPVFQQGYQTVTENVFTKFSAPNLTTWSVNTVFKGGIVKKTGLNVFPNPFNPVTSSLLLSVEQLSGNGETILAIYSAVDMDLTYSQSVQFTSFSGIQYAEWKGRDNNGRLVPSGVYIYMLSRGTSIVKGKFAVIR